MRIETAGCPCGHKLAFCHVKNWSNGMMESAKEIVEVFRAELAVWAVCRELDLVVEERERMIDQAVAAGHSKEEISGKLKSFMQDWWVVQRAGELLGK